MPTPQTPEHPLALCLKLLSQLGEAGQHVWELGKWYVGEPMAPPYFKNRKPVSQEERLEYLLQAIKWLKRKTSDDVTHWAKLPVDFRTFVDSPYYLNMPNVLWPAVLKHGLELNSGDYYEAVLTGAIGTAKTTLALYTQAFQTYMLACMDNPHEVFDLDPASEITIVFQSVNKNVAKDVDYTRMRNMIANSPWFEKHFAYNKDRESEIRFPRNIIIKPVAGHDQAAIGQNVIGGIIDEINFMALVENSKQSTDGSAYDQAMQNYNSIARRRESRFMQLGSLPGMLCLVSSRKYPGQFTDVKEEEAKHNPRIYVYSKRIWDLRPDRFSYHRGVMSEAMLEMYPPDTPLTFDVFIGDETRKPRILEPGERVPEADQHLVHWVPLENRKQFENKLSDSLRDILGVSTQALHPFMMNTDAIAACFGKTLNLVSREDADFAETSVKLYPKRIINPLEPRFIHLDPSQSKDSYGFAMGHVQRFVTINRGEVTETLPVLYYDVLLEIKPPRGGEILQAQVRKLIYALRNLGINVKWVTADNEAMSKDTLQLLSQQGFICGYQSMDTDTMGYDILKQAIYDGRVLAPVHPKAQKEVTQLEINPKTLMIDHNPTGSKDVADAMAGVSIGLTQRRELWVRHGVSMRNMPKSLVDPQKANKRSLTYMETLKEDRSKQRMREIDIA